MKINSKKTIGKIICTGLLIVSAFIFAACSEEEDHFNETTIKIEKKGRITENIVELFAKDYYSVDELTAQVTKEIENYNNTIGSEEIKLKSTEVKDGEIFVKIVFNGPSDYESFVGEELFVGTLGDACDNGYSMNVSLKGVDKGDIISKVQIMGMRDKTIVILSEPVRVKLFDDIAYVSANVDVINSREARILSESGGLAYIVLK